MYCQWVLTSRENDVVTPVCLSVCLCTDPIISLARSCPPVEPPEPPGAKGLMVISQPEKNSLPCTWSLFVWDF
jgi:hypothetical protein